MQNEGKGGGGAKRGDRGGEKREKKVHRPAILRILLGTACLAPTPLTTKTSKIKEEKRS